MNKVSLWAILASAVLFSGCKTTSIDNFLEEIGIVERPFNPDDVTITIMELKTTLPSYVANLKTLQQGQLAIRNLQIKLEQLDKQIKNNNNPNIQKPLLISFNKTFNQRVQLQDRASELIENVQKAVNKADKKRTKQIERINTVLPRYASEPQLKTKLKEQKSILIAFGAYLDNLLKASTNSEKTLEAMFDYTLQYDNNHPRIYGQAFSVENR